MGLISFFRFDTLELERSVTSYLYESKVLIYTRIIGTLYLLAVLIGALATTPSLRYFISFFTNITFCALLIYYMWSLVWSIQYCRLSKEDRELWAKKQSRTIAYLYWVLYGSLAVFHIIVPLIFWTLLRRHQNPHHGVYEWATVSEHTSDGILMILEIVSTRMLMDIRHIIFAIVFMLLYLLVTFVNWWINDTWVYSFLDFQAQGWTRTVLYYLGVAIGLIIFYILVWKAHDLKEYLGTKKARNSETIEAQEAELKVVQIDK